MQKSASVGVVKKGRVILKSHNAFPDGTEVLVTPLQLIPGSPHAVLAAMKAGPRVSSEAVDEFMRIIKQGKRPASFENPLLKSRRKRSK
jgi:hypothetical protein